MIEIAPRITVDENVRFGKPVIKGTRVPVSVVVGHLAAGDAMDAVMQEFGLAREDILASLAYAAQLLDEDEFQQLAK
jgi:uncharacterized protein (DUF433 family)